MFGIVNVLDVKQYGISIFHQRLKLAEIWFPSGERLCRCVKASVNTSKFGFAKKFYQEVNLQQCFAATYSDTSLVTPIRLISLCFIKEFVGREFLSFAKFPSIRIVAEQTSHRTSLQEDNKTNPRPVNRAEGFYRVNVCFYHIKESREPDVR